MYTGKIEPQNVTRQVQNALSDTLILEPIQLIIPEYEVSQEVKNRIVIYKKDKHTHASEELF